MKSGLSKPGTRPGRGGFDTLELKIRLIRPQVETGDEETVSYLVTQAIYVNRQKLVSGYPIDLIELAKSCQINGEFDIVTCGCGFAACAGIDDGIRVTHAADRITWEVPDPISYNGLSEEEAEEMAAHRRYNTFTFDPDQYLQAVQEGLRKAKGLLFGQRQPVECSPYGFEPAHLLTLDPVVFNERGAPAHSHLLAQHIEFYVDSFSLYMNGIPYRLNEIGAPDSIQALDNWSAWAPKHTENGTIYSYLAAPRWEVRRRAKHLGRYLASQQASPGSVSVIGQVGITSDGTRYERRCVFKGSWQGD